MSTKYKINDWWQLAPIEDVPWQPGEGDEREAFVQVFDNRAAEAMHEAFQVEKKKPNFVGLLVDWDHESTDLAKRTTGAAYITDTQVRADGLWGRPRLSADGQRDVEGGMLRFTSPTIPPSAFEDLGDGRRRPLRLDSVAITNRPRCQTLQPICNAITEPQITNTLPGTPSGEKRRPAAKPKQKEKPKMLTLSESTIAALLASLGLNPEEATDETVAAALGDHPTAEDVTAITNRITALEGLLVESDLDSHGITDETERKKFQPLLVTNRDAGLIALAAVKESRAVKPAKPGFVHNRASTQTPGDTQKKDAPVKNRMQLQREAINTELIGNRNNEQAYHAAKVKNPDLFKPEVEADA